MIRPNSHIHCPPDATIAVALSGGVDSAVACALLKEEGRKLVALTMTFGGETVTGGGLSCFGSREPVLLARAKAIAARLGIEHHVISVSDEYRREVLTYVQREYLQGRTPNPCVQCNAKVKLDALLKHAKDAGVRFDYVATGHYARTGWDAAQERFTLLRGVDRTKDQSYFLSMLSQHQLSQLILPLGGFCKRDVRRVAVEMDLADLVSREESQDFFRETTYRILVKSSSGSRPGPMVETNGKVLGSHRGLGHYTVGQRRGLGLGGSKEPWYVIRLDVSENRLVVGRRAEVFASGLQASGLNWISWPEAPASAFRASCQIRASHEAAPAFFRVLGDDTLEIRFDNPQFAVTPGQIAALYHGDALIGGGWITAPLQD